jgi:uncharacterized damage-inducible protein DinB
VLLGYFRPGRLTIKMVAMTWIAPDYQGRDEPFVADERTMLEGFLDWYRVGLLSRCSGLTGQQLAERAVPPSNLSLLGLVRHLTDVERDWFRRRFGGEQVGRTYSRRDRPDAAFEEADGALAARDLERLAAEQEAARRAVARLPLDAQFVSERWGDMSLRWAFSHMIAEYAGHCGHADLIRERIDGRTGW